MRKELIEKLGAGKLRLPVSGTYPLPRFRDALRLARTSPLGKTLLTLATSSRSSS